MAGPALGTLLIQRLDAALGTTLSQQTQIVNRATGDPVTHLSQPVRPEPVSNTLVRDGRSNVDRTTLNSTTQGRVGLQPGTPGATTPGSNTGQPFTTSATTSLGLAARLILNLFANQAGTTPPVIARAPLLHTGPQTATGSAAAGPTAVPGSASTTPAASTPPAASQGSQAGSAVHAPSGTHSTAVIAQSLVRALTHSLQHSGLFYESHLKGITTGQYGLSNIRQEPQAQIPGSRATTSTTAQNPTAPTALTANANSPATTPTTQSATPATLTNPTAQAVQQAPVPGIDPATHGIVRQQLEALADQSIQWRGEAWPGAPMDWYIRRPHDDDTNNKTHRETTSAWQSEVTIHLTELGTVTVGVSLVGKQLYVTLQANDDTTSLLQRHTDELQDQLSARQLELASMAFTKGQP